MIEFRGPQGEIYRKPDKPECCDPGPFCDSGPGCELRQLGQISKCPNPGCDVPWHGHVDLGPNVGAPNVAAARCLCITSDGREKCGIDHAESLRRKALTPPSPRMDMVIRLELEGRDPIEVPIPYQLDDQAPLIATRLVFIISGMPIFAVPFSTHGATLHTICTRNPTDPDNPASDEISAVEL